MHVLEVEFDHYWYERKEKSCINETESESTILMRTRMYINESPKKLTTRACVHITISMLMHVQGLGRHVI